MKNKTIVFISLLIILALIINYFYKNSIISNKDNTIMDSISSIDIAKNKCAELGGTEFDKLIYTKEAIQICKRAIEKEPKNYKNYLYLGRLYDSNENYKEAYKNYNIAAINGNARAQHNLGVLYENGSGAQEDNNKALEWYLKAAGQNFYLSYNNIAELYVNEEWVNYNPKKGFEWAKKAAPLSSSGTYVLANFYYLGLGTQVNIPKAIGLLEIARDKKNRDAIHDLGWHYEGKEDYQKAFKYYLEGAKLGYAWSQNNLGLMYYEGKGVEINYFESFKWYNEAAKQGMVLPLFNIGLMYDEGKGVPQNSSKAVEYFKKAIKNKIDVYDPYEALHWAYIEGNGVEKNINKAYKILIECVEKFNNPNCMNLIGYMHNSSYVFDKQDIKEALKWFTRAANLQDSTAMYNIGQLYYNDSGVEQNLDKAFEWFKKAAELNDIDAMDYIAYMYMNNIGVKPNQKNYSIGFKWLTKAAEAGHSISQFELGRILYIDKNNLKDATKWLLKSYNQRFKEAAGLLGWLNYELLNYNEALFYTKEGNYLDDGIAISNLGTLYEDGYSLEKNNDKAYELQISAAAYNEPIALYKLAQMHFLGKAPDSNNKEALKFIEAAINLTEINYEVEDHLFLDLRDLVIINYNNKDYNKITENLYNNVNNGYSGAMFHLCKFYENKESGRDIKNAYKWCYTYHKYLNYIDVEDSWRILIPTKNRLIATIERKDKILIEKEADLWFEKWLVDTKEFRENKTYLALNNLEKINILKNSANNVSAKSFNFGKYYALVIGNNDYEYEEYSDLKTPIVDAKEVAAVLKEDYGFNVILKTNATENDIYAALKNLNSLANENDNILIYYAGHGIDMPDREESFWLPVDATDNESAWISNYSIARQTRSFKAKHVIVIADSCFSGRLLRNIKTLDYTSEDIRRSLNSKVRLALTSGGVEPVLDGGGGKHSVFAKYFIKALKDNQGIQYSRKIYEELRKNIIINADQDPKYAHIPNTGSESPANFIFVRQ